MSSVDSVPHSKVCNVVLCTVQVPKYMSECWKKARPGDEVGKVVISKQKYVHFIHCVDLPAWN